MDDDRVRDLTLDTIGEDDFLTWGRAVNAQFHEDEPDEVLRAWQPRTELDRSWAVRDGDRIVGTYGIHSFDCSLPGGSGLACAGVTAVGVDATHRRRGVLTWMMRTGLEQAIDRREPLAALFASESPIYPRYGFGIAAPMVDHRIETARVTVDGDPALVEHADVETAVRDFPPIYDAVRAARGGGMSRSGTWWRSWLATDPEPWRDGATPRRLAHLPGRGYLIYRVKPDWSDRGGPSGETRVLELAATDPEANAALSAFALSIDLVSTCKLWLRPPDDPLLALASDRARLGTSESSPLYVRVLDVPAVLTARGYHNDGRVVLDVGDDFLDRGGRFRLEVRDGKAACEPTDEPADLGLPIDVLGGVFLGGVRTTQHIAAGRAVEQRDGAARELDRLLWVDHAPWCPFEF